MEDGDVVVEERACVSLRERACVECVCVVCVRWSDHVEM